LVQPKNTTRVATEDRESGPSTKQTKAQNSVTEIWKIG
jgi:hypothetical protein